MGEVILVFAVIAIMIGGFFVMKRLDAFLEENRKAIEKENQKKEIPLMLLDAENNEKAENYNCCYCDNNNHIFHKVAFF